MVASENLEHVIGDTKIINLKFKKSDGTPLDITGAKIYLTVKNNPKDDDANAVLQKIITSHTDPENGESQIVIDSNDTADKDSGTYVYDIQLVEAGGKVSTVVIGNYILKEDVTKTNT